MEELRNRGDLPGHENYNEALATNSGAPPTGAATESMIRVRVDRQGVIKAARVFHGSGERRPLGYGRYAPSLLAEWFPVATLIWRSNGVSATRRAPLECPPLHRPHL